MSMSFKANSAANTVTLVYNSEKDRMEWIDERNRKLWIRYTIVTAVVLLAGLAVYFHH